MPWLRSKYTKNDPEIITLSFGRLLASYLAAVTFWLRSSIHFEFC